MAMETPPGRYPDGDLWGCYPLQRKSCGGYKSQMGKLKAKTRDPHKGPKVLREHKGVGKSEKKGFDDSVYIHI